MFQFAHRKLYSKSVQTLRRLLPMRIHLRRQFTANTTAMYCMQCEQTSHNAGCTNQGICGKLPETSNMQDLLLYVNNGVSQYIHKMGDHNLKPDLKERFRANMIDSIFSTLTNVNFSEDRIEEYIRQTIAIRGEIKHEFRKLYPNTETFESAKETTTTDGGRSRSSSRSRSRPATYDIADAELIEKDAIKYASLYITQSQMQDKNCFGLRECAQYGLKGVAAYFAHAESMRKEDETIYTEEERDDVYNGLYSCMDSLCNLDEPLDYYLKVNMELGACNLKVLELLDRSHSHSFGFPVPTEVSSVPVPGKCILLSGHDVLDVKRILHDIHEMGVDVNVYTHGELLPAHSYPVFQQPAYAKHLVGHFGDAWQHQYKDFKAFPGPIILTSNCLMPPRRKYRGRLYTTHAVGYDDIQHVDMSDAAARRAVIAHALELPGFEQAFIDEKFGLGLDTDDGDSDSDDTEADAHAAALLPPKRPASMKIMQSKPHSTGFGHHSILSAHAGTILECIRSGDLQHIFYIGGCDGTEKVRSYFRDLAAVTPENSLILTSGCGKFRLHDLELGTLPGAGAGIPRILDLGQCNDAYAGVVIALKLAEALECSIHDLPLHFAVSWFEQKAVAIFLTLLHLGVKNIRLGPALPAFLTPDLRQYLFDNLGVQQVTQDDEHADMRAFLG